MKILLLVLETIRNKKLAFVLLTFQLVVSMFIFIGIISKVQDAYETYKITSSLDKSRGYYLPFFLFRLSSSGLTPEEFYNDVNKFKGEVSIGEVKSFNATIGGNDYNGYAYSLELLKHLQQPTVSGVSFDKYTGSLLPIISIGDTLKLNQKVSIKVFPNNSIEKSIVIGVLPRHTNILTFQAGGTAPGLDYLMAKESNALLVPLDRLSPASTVGMGDSLGKLIFPNKGISDKKINEVFSKYGNITDIQLLQKNYQKNLNQYFIVTIIPFVIFSLLSIIGIWGNNSVINLENEKTFAIYYMLGLSNRKCALIEGIRGFAVIVFSFATMLVLYNLPLIHNLFRLDPTTTVNWLTFTFIGLYLTLIYCVTSVGFIIKMEKSNLIDLYRNRD
ncbi:hypothetical protein MUB24_01355 [Lederbergia sp. NSJ-179]|uniref:hypothetical protein n=1 Tax=Lederbergia sp. NSJ-179 TaxID=2931402 RepID=UPI001FD2B5E7|nr:hypothetical protein [Lederbergia sp. NSJ-179]MCJ7839574.1 hypothetical protein [Lederbergia sp. NSJ-179]